MMRTASLIISGLMLVGILGVIGTDVNAGPESPPFGGAGIEQPDWAEPPPYCGVAGSIYYTRHGESHKATRSRLSGNWVQYWVYHWHPPYNRYVYQGYIWCSRQWPAGHLHEAGDVHELDGHALGGAKKRPAKIREADEQPVPLVAA